MKKILCAAGAAAMLMTGGCDATPWYEKLTGYPVIELGEKPPRDGNYVVHLPAGKPVPMEVRLKGNIFEKDTVQEVFATPRRDIYFYQDWMSFDMKNWKKKRASLELKWDVGIPSYANPNPGSLTFTVNEKD